MPEAFGDVMIKPDNATMLAKASTFVQSNMRDETHRLKMGMAV